MNNRQTTAESWVAKTPGVCGGDACLRSTRYTVAGLVRWRQLGLSDDEILSQHSDLTAVDLQSAWEYFNQHREEVELCIDAERETQMADS